MILIKINGYAYVMNLPWYINVQYVHCSWLLQLSSSAAIASPNLNLKSRFFEVKVTDLEKISVGRLDH